MGRGHVAAVNLGVALGAVGIESGLRGGIRAHVAQIGGIMEVRPFAVPGMAPQTEEGRRLTEQIVRHRPVRIVADRTIFRHGWMLVRERALFIGMALVTHHVDRGLLQVVLRLAMRIVAIRADHLAFLDRMVRRHRVLGIDIRVALVAHIRFVNRHGRPWIATDIYMLNVDYLLHIRVWVWVVAIRASDSIPRMDRRMPSHGR